MNLEIVSSQVTENPTNRSWNKYIWKNLLELVCLVHISIPFCLSTLLSLCVRLSSSCRGLHTSIPYHCLLLNTSSYPEPFWILWSRQVYLQAFAPFFFPPSPLTPLPTPTDPSDVSLDKASSRKSFLITKFWIQCPPNSSPITSLLGVLNYLFCEDRDCTNLFQCYIPGT